MDVSTHSRPNAAIEDVAPLILSFLTQTCDGSARTAMHACHAVGVLSVSGVLGRNPNPIATTFYHEIASKQQTFDLPALSREQRRITIPVIRQHLKQANIYVGSKASRATLLSSIPTMIAPPTLYGPMQTWRRDEAIAQAESRRQETRRQRTQTLEEAFAPRELVIRNDSTLCRRYISCGHGDPQEIAVVMDQMRFYFARTDYQRIRDAEYRHARSMGYDEYDEYDEYEEYGCGRINGKELSENAKRIAFAEYVKSLNTQQKSQDALRDPLLPPSLRARVVRQYDLTRLHAALQNTDPLSCELVSRMSAHDIASLYTTPVDLIKFLLRVHDDYIDKVDAVVDIISKRKISSHNLFYCCLCSYSSSKKRMKVHLDRVHPGSTMESSTRPGVIPKHEDFRAMKDFVMSGGYRTMTPIPPPEDVFAAYLDNGPPDRPRQLSSNSPGRM